MTTLVTIACLFAITGCFLILNLSPFAFLEGAGAFFRPKKTSLKSRIESSKKNKQPKGIKRLFLDVQEILRMTGKTHMFATLVAAAMLLFVLGALMALTMNNFYLIPVLAAGFFLLPFYYVKFTAGKHKKLINGELETALSMITTSYLRGNNTIIRAIEENEPYLNPPAAEVFRDFLMQTKLINSNTAEALALLKMGMDNSVFHEWVDGIIACQDDHNLKSTLPPIVGKLSDIRVVSAELDLLLLEPIKEYITMILLVLGSIPLMYFLNKEWYHILLETDFGKILLAVSGSVILISMAAVSKHTRPIEYRR